MRKCVGAHVGNFILSACIAYHSTQISPNAIVLICAFDIYNYNRQKQTRLRVCDTEPCLNMK